MTNTFLALRAEDIASFTEERRVVVRGRVEKDLQTAELIAKMAELFGPVMADTLNVLGGGGSVDYRDTPPDDEASPKPGGYDENIR